MVQGLVVLVVLVVVEAEAILPQDATHLPIHLNVLSQPQLSHPLPLLPPSALNLSREPAVQSQLRKVLPLLMMEAHRLRLPKSTSLTDHLKALVEVQEDWQFDLD